VLDITKLWILLLHFSDSIIQTFRHHVTTLKNSFWICSEHLCGLVVRVPGYRSRGPGFNSWRYHIFWEVVGLQQGPQSLVSTIEGLLGRNNSGSGLENRECSRGDLLRWLRNTLYPQKLTLTSPKSGGIVCSWTKAMEFVCFVWICSYWYLTSFDSIDQLRVPDEPPLVDVKCVKTRPGLFDRCKIPAAVSDLETLKYLSKRIMNEEMVGHLKYRSNIWLVSII
jgi:hypothetical protein